VPRTTRRRFSRALSSRLSFGVIWGQAGSSVWASTKVSRRSALRIICSFGIAPRLLSSQPRQ
jgi:hypothetical protein